MRTPVEGKFEIGPFKCKQEMLDSKKLQPGDVVITCADLTPFAFNQPVTPVPAGTEGTVVGVSLDWGGVPWRFSSKTCRSARKSSAFCSTSLSWCRAKSPSTRNRLHPQDIVHRPPLRWPRSRAHALPAHNCPCSNNIMAETSMQRHAPKSTRPSHCRAPVALFALAVVPSSFHQWTKLSTRRHLLRGEHSSHRGAHACLRVFLVSQEVAHAL